MVISRLLFPGHPRPGFTILLDLGFETGDIPLSLLELCRRGEEGEGRGCRVKVCETTACWRWDVVSICGSEASGWADAMD